MVIKIINGRILTPEGFLDHHSLYMENGKITAITAEEREFDEEIDAKGQFVTPGFIDIHVHGGGGFDFMDGGTEPIICAADFHFIHGTTSIMPTSLASSVETLKEFLENLRVVMREGKTKGTVLGAHLEGPYFAMSQSGAQNPDYIKAPVKEEYEDMIRNYSDVIRRWSFAPELENAEEFCETLLSNGIYPSIGHSDATYEHVEKIHKKGCNMVTHWYSALSTITRKQGIRILGVIESVYFLDGLNAEIIADGMHLPPELLKLIVKCKDTRNICLVTDAMRGAGMPDGNSLLGRKEEAMPCVIEDGVARLMDRSGFAGSVATTDRLVRTMVKLAGLDVETAVSMITEVPARLFDLKGKGKLAAGMDADVVIFDENINISYVFAGGEYEKTYQF